jgi:hypothetical protein
MTAPLDPDLLFNSSLAGIRPGSIVRVIRARHPRPIEGKLRHADAHGLTIEVRRPFFRTAADWSPEIDGEGDRPRMERMRLQEIERLWVRGRAVRAGTGWGLTLVLVLGWCGQQLDKLTDGFPRHENDYLGPLLGLVVGAAIYLLGREWREVRVSFDE